MRKTIAFFDCASGLSFGCVGSSPWSRPESGSMHDMRPVNPSGPRRPCDAWMALIVQK